MCLWKKLKCSVHSGWKGRWCVLNWLKIAICQHIQGLMDHSLANVSFVYRGFNPAFIFCHTAFVMWKNANMRTVDITQDFLCKINHMYEPPAHPALSRLTAGWRANFNNSAANGMSILVLLVWTSADAIEQGLIHLFHWFPICPFPNSTVINIALCNYTVTAYIWVAYSCISFNRLFMKP